MNKVVEDFFHPTLLTPTNVVLIASRSQLLGAFTKPMATTTFIIPVLPHFRIDQCKIYMKSFHEILITKF
jgi:hypothetical protein